LFARFHLPVSSRGSEDDDEIHPEGRFALEGQCVSRGSCFYCIIGFMSERPIVLVDMDGVLADFDGATEIFLRQNHPHIPIAERKNFYFRHDYPDETHHGLINDLHASQHFFRNLEPITDALEGWQRIIDLGYEPRICSSPLHTNEWCKEEKLAWVEHHLGRRAMKTALITSYKEECDGIALIDDRPEIKNATTAPWRHIIFDQPYNASIETELRLYGWRDPNLEALLEAAKAA
jgi:5'-nucleotidase